MKELHELITKFFENPTREKFRELIQFNTGEYENLDFKKEWPEASKLARHVLALANSGGGVIVVGVEETEEKQLNSTGLDKFEDKAIISSRLDTYLPNAIEYRVLDFTYKASDYDQLVGKSFQVMIIEYDPKIIPLVSLKEGKSIKENVIYVRHGTSSVIANYDNLQMLLNNRIATNYNTSSEIELEEHLAQLKMLYNKIEKYNYVYAKNSNHKNIFSMIEKLAINVSKNFLGEQEAIPNPNYPEEDYEQFILRMIARKKNRIETLLDV